MELDGKRTKWILMWNDETLIPVVRNLTKPTWQKALEKLIPRGLKIKPPFVELEYKTQVSFSAEIEILSERLEVNPPGQVYHEFARRKGFKPAVLQVAGELYYPMFLPTYFRCLSQFLLDLPGIPPDLQNELETKRQLPDMALQHEFAEAMEKEGHFSFNRYFVWAKKTYPGIDEDFKAYAVKEKPGFRRQTEGTEYCIPHFGHPSQPELFVYFPSEAKTYLPPPNGYMSAKVIGLVTYDAEPPRGLPNVHLRAVCLFGGIERR